MTEGKWIRFDLIMSTGKTSLYAVINKEHNIALGEVKWYGPWRKYAFFPFANRVFEKDCLQDITTFLGLLMLERKVKKQQHESV